MLAPAGGDRLVPLAMQDWLPEAGMGPTRNDGAAPNQTRNISRYQQPLPWMEDETHSSKVSRDASQGDSS
jgi:hypothetical protein